MVCTGGLNVQWGGVGWGGGCSTEETRVEQDVVLNSWDS